jgi:acylphosphatase
MSTMERYYYRNMLFRKKIIVSGKVQGVGFRYATQKHAQKIGDINGTVRNLADGTVEIVAEGEEKKVDDLIAWCYRGSTMSDVEKVEIVDSEEIEKMTFTGGFSMLKDA